MDGEALIAAVVSGDVKAVTALLEAGADPETVDGQGTPVLCLAVDAFDLPVVEVLLGWAQVDRVAADGRTPLLRAIDCGDLEIAEALIGHGAKLWLKDAEGRDALALARHWHVTGAVAELRRRSGISEPVGCRTVRGRFGITCEELSLGGLTVRTCHTAILTALEPRYGIRPSFEQLMSRALAEPDTDHAVWHATTSVLQQRHDPNVWEAAAGLRNSRNPLERYFGAELLRLINLFDESDDAPFDGPLVELFLPWVAREPDPRVTRALTAGLSDALDPRAKEPLPALTRHHDGRVRQWAVSGLHRAVEAEDLEALRAAIERTRDEDAAVRQAACRALTSAPARLAAASDALAGCLFDEDENVRVTAAAQLALRDDPRGDEVLVGLDPADEDSPYYWLLYDVRHHRRTRRASTIAGE
ncbi:ankyrin repeat domain-containing protein [Actinoallomurus rhizosphaericola]|uniref:ankyrin repeat domain-containing protein n=1 Tax=Actinoallomurus rhizosphaericola TaxID=2952536 RepID=UPI002092F2E1|nr:ankyrin repeat domain-containing protein [Actinoallomurus rhizosphaericola]MCO5995757.1 ankyrin repeat domain-containing protein [Actinoallomurus rhizosphaericola]